MKKYCCSVLISSIIFAATAYANNPITTDASYCPPSKDVHYGEEGYHASQGDWTSDDDDYEGKVVSFEMVWLDGGQEDDPHPYDALVVHCEYNTSDGGDSGTTVLTSPLFKTTIPLGPHWPQGPVIGGGQALCQPFANRMACPFEAVLIQPQISGHLAKERARNKSYNFA